MPQKSRTSTFKIFYFICDTCSLERTSWLSFEIRLKVIRTQSHLRMSIAEFKIQIQLVSEYVSSQNIHSYRLYHCSTFLKSQLVAQLMTTEAMLNKPRLRSFRQASENRRLIGYHLIPCIQLSLQKVFWLLTPLYQIRKQTIGCEYLPKNGYR